jgi:hypothetical protein
MHQGLGIQQQNPDNIHTAMWGQANIIYCPYPSACILPLCKQRGRSVPRYPAGTLTTALHLSCDAGCMMSAASAAGKHQPAELGLAIKDADAHHIHRIADFPLGCGIRDALQGQLTAMRRPCRVSAMCLPGKRVCSTRTSNRILGLSL